MSTRIFRSVLTSNQGFICPSCRLQSVAFERGLTRRYQHTSLGDSNGVNKLPGVPLEDVRSGEAFSRIEDLLGGPVGGDSEIGRKNKGSKLARSKGKTKRTPTALKDATPSADVTQQELRRKFAAQRRKDMQAMKARQAPESQEEINVLNEPSNHDSVPARSSRRKARKAEKIKGKSRALKERKSNIGINAIEESKTDSYPASKPTRRKEIAEAKNSLQKKMKSKKVPSPDAVKKSVTEKERKAKLVKALKVMVRRVEGKRRNLIKRVADQSQNPLVTGESLPDPVRKVGSSRISPIRRIQSSVGRRRDIEKADASKLEILPIEITQAQVPSLSYGLERVLFNPGVYQLQDPRSRVYNFDPYLEKIMPVAEFDFDALKEYITSSRDESLKQIAKAHGKRYVGSTSSMTGVLAHFHFLLSQWRPINTSMLSKAFPARLESFTELSRTPSAIFLRWRDGSYAIDADKQFDSENVLSMLGKSMEKLLTLNTEEYERYRKSSPDQVTNEEQLAPETYHYSTMGDFLMRSQLDAHDPRLPGTGMFDLKTRAVVSIRMDVRNYEHGLGYEIKSRQGEYESYEREYYDMIRAAFLKYSMQVRMGRMDGIFVAFHNVERIFGFQYISLPEMDSTIHGQWDTTIGDQEFKLSLDLLNKIVDKATQKFPETSIRLHFETREASTPFMYIFAEPVTEEQVAEVQSQNEAKVREFQRKVLGLTLGGDPDPQDFEDEDSRWDNIQADVQETMDKDERSVEQPNAEEDVEEDDLEEGDESVVAAAGNDESDVEAEDGSIDLADDAEDDHQAQEQGGEEVERLDEDAEDEDDPDQEPHEGEEEAEEEEAEEEEEEEEEEDKNTMELDPANESDEYEELEGNDEDNGNVEEVLEQDNAVSDEDNQAPDHGTAVAHGDSDEIEENSKLRARKRSEKGVLLSDSAAPNTTRELINLESSQNHTTPHIDQGKEGYTPSLLSEEPLEFPTEADKGFIDEVTEEFSYADPSTSPASDIFAMTLTIRNKVNDKFVLRPTGLTANDKWSIEYSLTEVETETRARALYQACQIRRKKKYDRMEMRDDEEKLSGYLQRLRELAAMGREWRARRDQEDTKKPLQVLGVGAVKRAGEDGGIEQEPDA